MVKPAQWSVVVTRRTTDAEGVVHIDATVADTGKDVADIAVSVTPGRALRVVVTNRPGAERFTGFDAWMKE